MRARPLLRFAWLAYAAACRPEPTPEPTTTPEPTASQSCGPQGERFEQLDWIPADARFVAWVAFDEDDGLAAADHLATFAADEQNALPIYAAAELSQLGFELSTMRSTLEFAGLFPAEIVKLHAEGGTPVYVWKSSCDLDEAKRRIDEAYGMATRRTVDAELGTVGDDSDFPFDMLFLRADRMAFAPRGQALAVLEWLGAPAEPSLTGQPMRPLGAELRALPPAPFRIALQGEALVAGQAETEGGLRTLRATAQGVEDSGSGSVSEPNDAPDEDTTDE